MKVPPEVIGYAIKGYYEGLSLKSIRDLESQKFGFSPSISSLFRWINHYTQCLIEKTSNTIARVGAVWALIQSVTTIQGRNIWFYDILDFETGLLMESRLFGKPESINFESLFLSKKFETNRLPVTILTNKSLFPILTNLESDPKYIVSFHDETEFNTNSNIICFNREIMIRTNSLHRLKSIYSALRFTVGWLINYNYFRKSNDSHIDSPAKAAGLMCSYESWIDVAKDPSLDPFLLGDLSIAHIYKH